MNGVGTDNKINAVKNQGLLSSATSCCDV